MLYTIFELVQPGSLIQANGGHIDSFSQAVYFSFTTLCTVGYGDITPKAHLAMVFANLEAITGQLYLAILVARLVTLYTTHNANPD